LDVNHEFTDGETLLHVAVNRGLIGFVTKLIDKNADVNKQTKNGMAPIHYSATSNNGDIARELIKYKCDIHIKHDGKSVLHLLPPESNFKILIDANCDISCKDKDNKTPLQFHWEKGNGKACLELLQNGAKIDWNAINSNPFLYFGGSNSIKFKDMNNFHNRSPHPITVEFFINTLRHDHTLFYAHQEYQPSNPVPNRFYASCPFKNGKLYWAYTGNGEPAMSSNFPSEGAWTHVALIGGGKSMPGLIYLDGKRVFKKENGDEPNASWFSGPLVIGHKFCGCLAHFKIWERVLTEEEINIVAKLEDIGRDKLCVEIVPDKDRNRAVNACTNESAELGENVYWVGSVD